MTTKKKKQYAEPPKWAVAIIVIVFFILCIGGCSALINSAQPSKKEAQESQEYEAEQAKGKEAQAAEESKHKSEWTTQEGEELEQGGGIAHGVSSSLTLCLIQHIESRYSPHEIEAMSSEERNTAAETMGRSCG